MKFIMSKFRSWYTLHFLINIYFISGIEEPNNPVRKPWLDLNLDPEDLLEQPENVLDEPRRPWLDLNLEPQDTPEHPEVIIGPTNNSLQTNSPMHQNGSSSNNESITQRVLEMSLLKTEQKWDELQIDSIIPVGLLSKKWEELCYYMFHKILAPGKYPRDIDCKPTPYILGTTQRRRRIKFIELKNNTKDILVASDLLICFCAYYSDGVKKRLNERFAIKPYEDKEYFVLKRCERNPYSFFWVFSIEPYT